MLCALSGGNATLGCSQEGASQESHGNIISVLGARESRPQLNGGEDLEQARRFPIATECNADCPIREDYRAELEHKPTYSHAHRAFPFDRHF
jgi:hypothetical protein